MDATQSFLELIHRRASAEEFAPGTELTREQIEQLVHDAGRAPSSFNIQHWRFLAVRAGEDKQRLQAAAYGQCQVADAAVTFVVLGDTRGVERLPSILEQAVARGAIASAKAAAWTRMARDIYADPGVARDEAIRSGSLAAMTMMFAAEARGLVACALTGFDPARVAREFDIPDRYVTVMLLAVGHPAGVDRQRMPRLETSEILVFDRWSGPSDE